MEIAIEHISRPPTVIVIDCLDRFRKFHSPEGKEELRELEELRHRAKEIGAQERNYDIQKLNSNCLFLLFPILGNFAHL